MLSTFIPMKSKSRQAPDNVRIFFNAVCNSKHVNIRCSRRIRKKGARTYLRTGNVLPEPHILVQAVCLEIGT